MFNFLRNHSAFILILTAFVVLSTLSAFRESLTFDEVIDLQEGRNAVLQKTFDIDPYNPPLTREIAVFPYVFSNKFYSSSNYLLDNPFPARSSSIFFGIGLLLLVYMFTLTNFGKAQANLAAILTAFEPNILANSHYITMDIGLTFFFLLSIVLLFRIFKNPSWVNIFFLAISIGFGMATKISFIPYFGISFIFLSVFQFKSQIPHLLQYWKKTLFLVCIVLLTIWSAYFFSWHIFIKQRSDASRVSAKLQSYAQKKNIVFIATALHFFEKQPIPLGDYVAIIKNNALRGIQNTQCFFLGKFYSSCKAYFMPINFLLKTPLVLLLLFFVSIVLFIQRKKTVIQSFVFMPTCIVLLSSMIFGMMPLVRYILSLYPFIAIGVASSLFFWRKNRTRKLVLTVFLLWYVTGTLLSFPHFISYANEVTANSKHFLLIDSNMDWGQSLYDVSKFVEKNKESRITFSYFGRDDGNKYGLLSDKPYESYKNNEICEFHNLGNTISKNTITLISITNWYNCGYNRQQQYRKENFKKVIGDSVFVF